MRTFIKKWKISLVYTLLPILLYGVLGPLEIYAGNSDEFVFILKDFFIFFSVVSLLLWLLGSAVLAFLPEKVRDVLHLMIFIFSVLSYVQNLLLNSRLMNENGSPMEWNSMKGTMTANLIVWIVLAGVLAVLPFVWKKKWRKIYLGIIAFISAVQLVTIVSLLITTIPIEYRQMTLSGEGMLQTAPGSNVIVLSFDSLYNTQFEETMADHPEIAETLKDFTYYNNADSHYAFTYPSVKHMLTGIDFDSNDPEWANTCWLEERSRKFYDTLHSLGYECDLYVSDVAGDVSYFLKPSEEMKGFIDNISSSPFLIDHRLLYVELEKMTIYKYVPYILKPKFEVMDYVIQRAVGWELNSIPRENADFYQTLLEEGLSVDPALNNKFSLVHLIGIHKECRTNSDGTYCEEGLTSQAETSEGVAVLIQEYIRQLQNLEGDVYDNATIIITADHGLSLNAPQPVYFIKPPHTSQEEMQITSAPVSHDDFQATVMECIGQSHEGEYGTSIFDWKEGDHRTRELWLPTRGGYHIYSYDTDRYELMGLSEEDGVFMQSY